MRENKMLKMGHLKQKNKKNDYSQLLLYNGRNGSKPVWAFGEHADSLQNEEIRQLLIFTRFTTIPHNEYIHFAEDYHVY